jgi:hypothetical protein
MTTTDPTPGGRSLRRLRRSAWVALAFSLASGLVAVTATNFSRSCSEIGAPDWAAIPFVAAGLLAVAAVIISIRARAIPEILAGVALIAGCALLYFAWIAIGLADPCQSGSVAALR